MTVDSVEELIVAGVVGGRVEEGGTLAAVAVKVYVMQEQALLTALISPSQLLKLVGIAEGAVVVPERNPKQKPGAS